MKNDPPPHEIRLKAREIDRLYRAEIPVAEVFVLREGVFRVTDALLALYAKDATIASGDLKEMGDTSGPMWRRELQRESIARQGDEEIGRASVSIYASAHPYDGDGWRIQISVGATAGPRLSVDTCSHDGVPGILLRGDGPMPEGTAEAFRLGFTIV